MNHQDNPNNENLDWLIGNGLIQKTGQCTVGFRSTQDLFILSRKGILHHRRNQMEGWHSLLV